MTRQESAEEERDFVARRLLHSEDPALGTLVDRFTTAMCSKLGRKLAEGCCGWSAIDDPDWTVDVIKKRLRNHIDKGDPVDVANYALFWWYLETVAKQKPEGGE